MLTWMKVRQSRAVPSCSDLQERLRHRQADGGTASRDDADGSRGPLVSVVMVTYNAGRFLRDALASIAAQTYRPIEVLVVDGGSKDGTLSILREHNSLIHWWISEPDAGMYDALNKAIARARGKYIKHLNADDLLELRCLEVAVALAEANGGYGLVKGRMQIIDEQGERIAVIDKRNRLPHLGEEHTVLHPTWLIARKVHEDVGLYDTSFRCAADTDFNHRLLQAKVPIWHSDEVLASFRRGGMSSTLRTATEAYRCHQPYLGVARSAQLLAYGLVTRSAQQWLPRILGESGAAKLSRMRHRLCAAARARAGA